MDVQTPPHHSQLFTLRVWQEQMTDGQAEWRGQVQRVTTGETLYFRDWHTLIAHLVNLLTNLTD